jgi:DNA-binding PadR family transcriptional regulator
MIISALRPGEELTTKEIAQRLSENTKRLFRSEESFLGSLDYFLRKLEKEGLVEKRWFGQWMWRLR